MVESKLAGPLYRPKRASALQVLLAVEELAKLPLFWPKLGSLPRGSKRVMVVPGFLTGDRSTWLLRQALERLGHDVHGWELGQNDGDVWSLIPKLTQRVHDLASKGQVHLVGWSLGGYLAREVARDTPDVVAQVITMASPVIGGPKYTAAAEYYEASLGVDVNDVARQVAAREEVPLMTPVTALYSRKDGVVCPAACIDHVNAQVKHLVVDCAHTGFGFSPEVIRVLATILATK